MTAPVPQSLADWLQYIERQHPRAIELGLERVRRVQDALGISAKPAFPVITVGGTNGKGSSCALLEAILQNAGYRVGCYTSPHLLRYNERVRVNGVEADDATLCRAFAQVEDARVACASVGHTLPLTYFEFGTLAAMQVFCAAHVDVVILEVGLGGRLDAVNVFAPDAALVTSVDLDHTDYLGATRAAIGYEKAGIFRSNTPAICADHDPPPSLIEHAHAMNAKLYLIDRDFSYTRSAGQWTWRMQREHDAGILEHLPAPALRGDYQFDNAAACLMVLATLRDRLPVTQAQINAGLRQAQVAGRFQIVSEHPQVILDVAHNPQAARALAGNLAQMPALKSALRPALLGKTHAVFSMLSDKDIAGVVDAVKPHIHDWHVAPSTGARGATAAHLAQVLQNAGIAASNVFSYATVAQAYDAAHKRAGGDDRIIVFGSFLTVAAVDAVIRE